MKPIYCIYHIASRPVFLIMAMIIACLPGYAAEGYESVPQLKSMIETWVRANAAHEEQDEVVVQVGQLDGLKLRACEKKVTVSFAKEAGPANQPGAVILSCESRDTWNVYVPIQIQIMTRVLAVNRLVSPGELLGENDVDLTVYDKNRLYDGYFKNKEDVVGMSASRSINAGTPLTRKNLKQVAMIKRNQTITLSLRRGAIEIEMIGIAKTDGYKDGPVKVFNPSSKKLVDAIVVSKNRAEITY
ncbi:flagellar basal body P-ring formation chaperone FlgA [Legionella sp. CNM-4043-24]|uniref:flagellar basal body P-ring formation chaperone FlgA n=1 Tax=Legionella sp. CNM-4043-24 TaxID=3421646 RepID=UPI00403AEAA1